MPFASLFFVASVAHGKIAASALSSAVIPYSETKSLNLISHKYKPQKCYALRKLGAEVTRASKSLKAELRNCTLFNQDHWWIQDDEKGQYFLTPAHAIQDIVLPFFQNKVAQKGQLDFPVQDWVQLYRNGIYRGVYLRTPMMGDPTKASGRKSSRRSLLFLDGNGLTYIDTKLRERSDGLGELTAKGATISLANLDPYALQIFNLSDRRSLTIRLTGTKADLYPYPRPLKSYREALVGGFQAPHTDSRLAKIAEAIYSAKVQYPLSEQVLLEGVDKHLKELEVMFIAQARLEGRPLDWAAYLKNHSASFQKVNSL